MLDGNTAALDKYEDEQARLDVCRIQSVASPSQLDQIKEKISRETLNGILEVTLFDLLNGSPTQSNRGFELLCHALGKAYNQANADEFSIYAELGDVNEKVEQIKNIIE